MEGKEGGWKEERETIKSIVKMHAPKLVLILRSFMSSYCDDFENP